MQGNPLDPLPEPAVESYLCERFDWQQAPSGLTAVMEDQTDGNPLFMVTLTSYLIAVKRWNRELVLCVTCRNRDIVSWI